MENTTKKTKEEIEKEWEVIRVLQGILSDAMSAMDKMTPEYLFEDLCIDVTVRLFSKDRDMPDGSLFEERLDLRAFYFVDGEPLTNEKLEEAYGLHFEDFTEEMQKTLYERAAKNTSEESPVIITGLDTVAGFTRETDWKHGLAYVCLTKDMKYGAAAMLYPGFLKDVAEKIGSDFYILPSSVHELIFVRALEGCDSLELMKTVREINGDPSLMCPADFLSNSVYYYDSSKNAVCKIA